MISLSRKLYTRCRGIFLKCSEFDDDDRLRTVFVVDTLSPFRYGLPNSRSKIERVEKCLAFLLEKQFIENDYLLSVFVLVLRDRYTDEKYLWNELNDLYQAVNEEISNKHQQLQDEFVSQEVNQYGELIEATVERTKKHTQTITDISSFDIPKGRKKEEKTKISQAGAKRDFFISYNRHDKQWAEWIAWQLEDEGYSTIIQAWDFRPGSNFVAAMHKAASSAERTIAVLSPDYVESQFTVPEWNNAFAQDPTGEKGLLLPIKVRNFELEGLLRQIVYIDLVEKSVEDARATLLAGIKRERAKPTIAPEFPTEFGSQEASKRDVLAGNGDKKNIVQIKPSNDRSANDVPALLNRVATIYNKNASILLSKLHEQINKTNPQRIEQFKKWLIDLTSNQEIPEISQDLESWLVVTLEQYVRLIGVDDMPDIFSQYYEELPPTDRHAAFLIEKAAIDIERSMLSMAICREDNRKIRIGAKFIKESQRHLEDMEKAIHAVLDLFNRYTPPDTILPKELRHERVFDVIANYSQVLDGINAHIAMRGKLSPEYINKIERNYDDLVIYTGSFIEWLKKLANRASRANSFL